MEFAHESVMKDETLELLNVRPGGVYIDGTAGGGGHSYEIASRLQGSGRLVCIDRDESAIRAAGERLAPFGPLVQMEHGNYSEIREIAQSLGIMKVWGVLLDLGVSSHQLDEAERGFSYMKDAPLDMRMDRREERTAAEVVNTLSVEELTRIIRDYGEEKFAGNVARAIVKAREEAPIRTTLELSDIISGAIPAKYQKGHGHPAKKTFQAIRIELNGELSALTDSLDVMADMLEDGGRLAVITFHSLEDRIVKNAFKRFEDPCTCPPSFPVCVCGKKPLGQIITRRPVVPTKDEILRNSRSKSAKLRVFERKAALL